MILGLAAPPFSAFLALEAQVGKLGARRSYEQGAGNLPSTYSLAACSVDASDNLLSAYSVPLDSVSAQAVGAGSYDARMVRFWQSVPVGAKLQFCWAHEADAKINKQVAGTYTADELGGAYERTRLVLNRERAAGRCLNVDLVANLTAYYWAGSTAASGTLGRMLAAADIVAADAYGQGLFSPSGIQSAYAAAAATAGWRTGIWEFSTQPTQAGGRPQWITDFLAFAFAQGYEIVLGFNSSVGGSSPLLGDAGSIAAFKDAVTFYGKSGAVLPILTPLSNVTLGATAARLTYSRARP